MDSVLVAWHSSKYVNVDHFRIFVWNWKALRKQSGSSQDGSRSVSGVQEQQQEVAEALPAAAKKGSKVQTLLVLLSSIPHFQDFSYFDIFHHISTIFYASNIVQSNLLSCEQLSKFLFACLVLGWNKFHQVVRLSLGFVSSKQLNMLP